MFVSLILLLYHVYWISPHIVCSSASFFLYLSSLKVESSTVQERAVGSAAAGDEGRSNEQNNISSGHEFGETSQPFPGVSNTTNQEVCFAKLVKI